MFTTSPAVRIANSRQNETAAACRPSVNRQPSDSRPYMRTDGSRMMRMAASPTPVTASRMRAGPMCQTRPTNVKRPRKRRTSLSTCKRRGPSDPSQHDPEDIRADRRQPEEPFQFAYERKDQQDHRKISTGHVLKKELRPRSLQWCAPRTLLTEG